MLIESLLVDILPSRLADQEAKISELESVKLESGKCRIAVTSAGPATPPPPTTLSAWNEERASLIRSYGNLYAQSRLETQEWLDQLEQLRHADQLKSKLLFSVIVVFQCALSNSLLKLKLNNQNETSIYICISFYAHLFGYYSNHIHFIINIPIPIHLSYVPI